MSSYLQAAIDAAKESGAFQLANIGKAHQIDFKGEINLVTEVDRACEKIIADKIQGVFPDHDILSEEGGGERRDSDYKWIVDPLDGTTNFAHGYPLFCTSIALEHKGRIVLGVVFDPNRGELFHAEEGGGSFLNGEKIHVSQISSVDKSLLATGFAYNVKRTMKNNITNFKNMILAAQAVRRDGVAAVDLCYVACGRYDGFWELNLFPWDVAAGFIIIKEAGGVVTNFSGDPFTVYDKEILATNSLIHQKMVSILKSEEKKQKRIVVSSSGFKIEAGN